MSWTGVFRDVKPWGKRKLWVGGEKMDCIVGGRPGP